MIQKSLASIVLTGIGLSSIAGCESFFLTMAPPVLIVPEEIQNDYRIQTDAFLVGNLQPTGVFATTSDVPEKTFRSKSILEKQREISQQRWEMDKTLITFKKMAGKDDAFTYSGVLSLGDLIHNRMIKEEEFLNLAREYQQLLAPA